MKYELYLRMPDGAGKLSKARAQESLEHREFSLSQGAEVGRLELGQGQLTAEFYRRCDWDGGDQPTGEEETGLDGINFSLPMGIPEAEGDRAIQCILSVKDDLGTDLFDPQLGELVTRADQQRILETWAKSHDFQFGVVGTPGLGSGPLTSPPPAGGIPARFKMILLVAVLILAGIFLFRSCFRRWLDRNMNPPHPDDDITEYRGP